MPWILENIQKLAVQADIPNEIMPSVEEAFTHALEMSEKDGSIVSLPAQMFVTAEVMAAWKKQIETDLASRSTSARISV